MYGVYIVDDEAIVVQDLINTIPWLENGFEVIGFNTNPQSALKEIFDKQPDVIFCDLTMPGCDGIELIKLIRENNVKTEFILLSAFAEFEASRSFFLMDGNAALGLTSLIRYAYDEEEGINIWDELDILQNYVYIMNIRYNGKLYADFDFDDRLMYYIMPRMLLQPVIENSIVHGFADMDSDCMISVKAVLGGGAIVFTIRDNGRGMDEDEMATLKENLDSGSTDAKGIENIALANINMRLYYYYGNDGRLSIQSNNGKGLAVNISIPLFFKAGVPHV